MTPTIMATKNYYIYILTNQNNTTFYIGVTNNLERRTYEHKNGLIDGFSKKYKLKKVVYFEECTDIKSSIAREKQLKELIKIVNSIKNNVILMGDFNTFNGSCEIKQLLKMTNLKDSARLHHHTISSTQPSCRPKRRLDYVLTSKKIKVKHYEVLKYPFSDHMPVFVEFDLR